MSEEFDALLDEVRQAEGRAAQMRAVPRRFTLRGQVVVFDADLPEIGGMQYEMRGPARHPQDRERFGVVIPTSVWMLLGGFRHTDPEQMLWLRTHLADGYAQFLLAHEFDPRRQHYALYDPDRDAWCVFYCSRDELEHVLDMHHPDLSPAERAQKLTDELEGRYWAA